MKPQNFPHGSRSFFLPLGWLLALSVGCVAADEDDAADTPELGVSEQALDNSVDPDDGKACYVDGPKERKGKMEGSYCCYDTENGNACVWCDKEHQCTVGGGAGPIVALTAEGWWTPPKTPPKVALTPSGTLTRVP